MNVTLAVLHDIKKIAQAQRALSRACDKLYNDLAGIASGPDSGILERRIRGGEKFFKEAE